MALRPRLITAATLLALPLLSLPAAAQDAGCGGPVSATEAIRIATGAGVAEVRDVDCDDGRWEVEGRDANGRKIEVEIHATTGQVLDIDRAD